MSRKGVAGQNTGREKTREMYVRTEKREKTQEKKRNGRGKNRRREKRQEPKSSAQDIC